MKRCLMGFFVMLTLVGCSSKKENNDNNNNGGGNNPVTKRDCALPWGGTIGNGSSVTAYKDSDSTVCQNEMRACNDGTLSGSFKNQTCSVQGGNTDPSPIPGEEFPVRIDAEGKKWGGLKIVSEKSMWTLDQLPMEEQRPTCPKGAVMGTICDDDNGLRCLLADKRKAICEKRSIYKLWGWIYEKENAKLSPLGGVKLDIFWFAGCLAGTCSPMAPAVESKSNGYFEIYTGNILDTLRIISKDGYFGICNGKTPIAGGGTYIQSMQPGDTTGGFIQYKIKADSCRFGVPE